MLCMRKSKTLRMRVRDLTCDLQLNGKENEAQVITLTSGLLIVVISHTLNGSTNIDES